MSTGFQRQLPHQLPLTRRATRRDSLAILNGLVEHQTNLQPSEIMSDKARYTDVTFGLC